MAIHLICYFGSQYLEGKPHAVGWKIDEKIPFVPELVYVYCSWFVLLFLVPFLLSRVDAALCMRFLIAYVLDHFISTACYLIYPTTFQRPAPAGRGLTLFGIKKVYSSNHRFLNCAPSMHCSGSFIILFAAVACSAFPLALQVFLAALCLAIVVSTLLVKQHVLVDVITAVPTAVVCWLLAGMTWAQNLAQRLL